jgi:tRNA(fMet)-specific endonuclease VapC
VIHLDANAAIALLNERPLSVRTLRGGAAFALSIVVYHELMYGAAASERRLANDEKIALFVATGDFSLLPFEEADAREAADIRAHLKRGGAPMGPYDMFVAAPARRRGATLVTSNGREFERVPGADRDGLGGEMRVKAPG